MSRKDYVAIAEILRKTPMESGTRAQLVARFGTALADDNPRRGAGPRTRSMRHEFPPNPGGGERLRH
jgi:hypothetical protein